MKKINHGYLEKNNATSVKYQLNGLLEQISCKGRQGKSQERIDTLTGIGVQAP